jgi:hypothetical protein
MGDLKIVPIEVGVRGVVESTTIKREGGESGRSRARGADGGGGCDRSVSVRGGGMEEVSAGGNVGGDMVTVPVVLTVHSSVNPGRPERRSPPAEARDCLARRSSGVDRWGPG